MRRGRPAGSAMAGLPPLSRRAGEGLGDVQPEVRRRGRWRPGTVSARFTRWVTSRQKSYAAPVTVCAASSGPQAHRSPDGAVRSIRNSSVGGGGAMRRERAVAGANAEVGDVPDAVGDLGLDVERRVYVERVRPGLHEPRGGHGGGGHRRPVPRDPRPGGVGRAASRRAGRAPYASARAGPAAPRCRRSGRPGRPTCSGSANASSTSASQRLLVGRGGAGGLVGPGQVGDLGGDVPARGGCRQCARRRRAGRRRATPGGADSVGEVVEHDGRVRRSSSAPRRECAPTGRGSGCDGGCRR